jgi:ribosomal protein L29
MRSKVAEEVRREQIEEIREMSVSERLALVRAAREHAIALYVAGQQVDRETAIRQIRRQRQDGRRYSRCMIESL